MSSRQMKMLFGGNTLPPPSEESDEDYQPLYTKISPSKYKYQGLVVSSNSESEYESNDSVEIESPVPEKLPKKTKKKKKKHIKAKQPELNYDPEMDEIDRSVKEVNAILGSPPPAPASAAAGVASYSSVMAVELRHLKFSYEFRRRFGPGEEDERKRRRARVPSLIQKKWVIVPMGENVINYRKYGLSMSVNRVENGCKYFTFDHDEEYQKLHRSYLRYMASLSEEFDVDLVMHVDTLIQAADTMFDMEDYTDAQTVIEQTIAFMQCILHPSLNLADINVRLEYRVLENRAFHVSILKYLHLLTNRACHRTALELAKLLLNLDPSDPLGVLLVVDVLALRAREFAWLIEAIEVWTKERDAGFLFNMQYSNALAHFHVTKKNKGDMSYADELLQNAISKFPLLAMKISEYGYIKLSDKAKSSALFNAVADSATTHLKELINLHAKFVWSNWHERAVLEWFTRNVGRLADRYDQDQALQEQVKVWTNVRLNLFQGWPEQIMRHLMVIKPMSSLLVDGAVPSVGKQASFSCNPLPPADTLNRYGYQYRVTPTAVAPAVNYSPYVEFFRSLLPQYNIIVTGQNEENGAAVIQDEPDAELEEDVHFPDIPEDIGIDNLVLVGLGGADEEVELHIGGERLDSPTDLYISIEDLTNTVRTFIDVYENGFRNDREEGPNSPQQSDDN